MSKHAAAQHTKELDNGVRFERMRELVSSYLRRDLRVIHLLRAGLDLFTRPFRTAQISSRYRQSHEVEGMLRHMLGASGDYQRITGLGRADHIRSSDVLLYTVDVERGHHFSSTALTMSKRKLEHDPSPIPQQR